MYICIYICIYHKVCKRIAKHLCWRNLPDGAKRLKRAYNAWAGKNMKEVEEWQFGPSMMASCKADRAFTSAAVRLVDDVIVWPQI
jgi:hypothetical protein